MAGIQTSQGIGSGEAQVIGTPLTNQAMFNATRIAEARRAKQAEAEAKLKADQNKLDEEIAKDLLKTDISKTWVKDRPRLMKTYRENLVGAFSEYKKARTDEERDAAKLKYDEAKINMEADISESRDKNDKFRQVSEVILGLSPDERDETFLQQFSAIKEKDSRDWNLDPTAAVKLPKDVDLLKMREDVADASLMAKQPTTDIVEIDGVRLVRNTKGQIIDPVAFSENIKIKSMSSRPYAKFLKTQYFDEWTKSGGDAGDLEGFLEFAGNKEYDIYRKTKDKTEVTTSQVGTQPTYNFGSNGGRSTYIQDFGIESTGNITTKKTFTTPNGRRVSEKAVVPVGRQRTVNVSYLATGSNGWFDMSNGGEFDKPSAPIQVKSSRAVQVPVFEDKATGNLTLANLTYQNTITDPTTGERIENKSKSVKYKTKPKMITVLEVLDADDNVYLQPIDQVVSDAITKADAPAFQEISTWETMPVNRKASAPVSAPKKATGTKEIKGF